MLYSWHEQGGEVGRQTDGKDTEQHSEKLE